MRGPQKYGAVSRGERTGEPARLAAVRRDRAYHPGTCINGVQGKVPAALRDRRGPITGHVRLTERHPAGSEPGARPGLPPPLAMQGKADRNHPARLGPSSEA